MIKLLKSRLGLRIAVLVNAMLFVVIILGSAFLINQYDKNMEDQFYSKAKMLSLIGAKGISRIIEEAIDNGVMTADAAVDRQYVPIPGLNPSAPKFQKFHTKYDAYMDKAILSYLDEFIEKDKTVSGAIAVDVNGYCPTHVSRWQKPLTGNTSEDEKYNRTKRIFNDPIGLAAAKNQIEGYRQVYDVGLGVGWDVSSPIYVRGKHWGGFRYVVSLASVEAAKREHVMYLVTVMLLILIVSCVSVFALIQKSLAPLKEFTRIASELADGNVEEEIKSTSEDEIGQLANVLERLRISIKAAMDRLMRK